MRTIKVNLPPVRIQALRSSAEELGISVSELMRRILDDARPLEPTTRRSTSCDTPTPCSSSPPSSPSSS